MSAAWGDCGWTGHVYSSTSFLKVRGKPLMPSSFLLAGMQRSWQEAKQPSWRVRKPHTEDEGKEPGCPDHVEKSPSPTCPAYLDSFLERKLHSCNKPKRTFCVFQIIYSYCPSNVPSPTWVWDGYPKCAHYMDVKTKSWEDQEAGPRLRWLWCLLQHRPCTCVLPSSTKLLDLLIVLTFP